MLNNLYHDINTNIFYEIEENGECTEVAKIINNDCAYIKLKSLMKFAAAKQMALLLFFDIRVKISGSLQKNGLKEFSTTVNEDGLFFGLWGGEQRLLETYSYSILMGKRILLPKPVEECGYEPYSRNEEIVKQFKNPTDLKGGISKLEYWLSELNFPDYQQQIKFLRNLQELRSTGTGHRKGKGHEKAAGVFGLNTDNYVDVFDRILLQANAFILFLAKNFLKDWTVTLS